MKRTYILAGALLLGSSIGQAVPITYIESVVASGSLGANSFSDALVTLTMTGDTSNVQLLAGDHSLILLSGLMIDVAGLPVATLTDAGHILADPADPFFTISIVTTSSGGILDTEDFSLSLPTYTLANPIGPITGSAIANYGATFNTSAGAFVLESPQGNSTFTAIGGIASPEPASFVLFSGALTSALFISLYRLARLRRV